MEEIILCPDKLPDDIEIHIHKFAEAWAKSDLRPRVSTNELKYWDGLIQDWVKESDIPLYVRKASTGRGQILFHQTGRKIIPTDNSPAHWSFLQALAGETPTLDEIKSFVENDQIPVAMILKKNEKKQAAFTNTMRGGLNKSGWKVCHIEPVGLNKKVDLTTVPIEELKLHLTKFLSPSNMFLIPKRLGGLGEIPQVIEVMKNYR